MLARALFTRPLVRRPLRFATTVVGVAAGVASIVATLFSSRAALYALREGVDELAGRARLEITRPGGIEESLLGTLRPLTRDAVLAPVVDELALCPALDDSVQLYGIDALVDGAVRDHFALAEDGKDGSASSTGPTDGSLAASGEAGETGLALLRGEGAWVAAPLAITLGLAVGGTLDLELRGRPVALRVLGTFPVAESAPALARMVVVDVALAQELCGRAGRLDRIELVPRAGVDLARLRVDAAALLPAGTSVAEPARRGARADAMVRSLEFNLAALSGISLFAGAVLVATTLATSVVQRRGTIALLRSLGASSAALTGTLLCEALVIGLLGSGLGVLLGYWGARVLASSMRGTVATVVGSVPPTEIRFDPAYALLGAALGVLVSLVAAVLPVLEARATPPIQALRRERPQHLERRARRIALAAAIGFVLAAVELARLQPIAGLPVPALTAALSLMCALLCVCAPALDMLGSLGSRTAGARLGTHVLRLAAAALAAGRRRAAWAAGAVGVAVALAIAIATLVTSFRTTVVDWTRAGLRADLVVRPRGGTLGIPIGKLDARLVGRTTELFGSAAVDPFHSTPAVAAGRDVTLGGAALDVLARRGGLPFRNEADSRRVFERAWREHGAIVSEVFALRTGLGEEEMVEVQVNGLDFQRRIVGVYTDYGDSQGSIVIDRADYLAFVPADGPREIALFLPEDTDPGEARRTLERELAGEFRVDVLERAEIHANVLAVFDRTFAITRALQLVAIAVAVIAVLSVLSALVAERQVDLALLRALGATRFQLGAQVALQAGMLGMLGAGAGALTGVWIGLILVKVVNLQSFGWDLEFVQPWSALAGTAVAVVGACALAGAWPAVRASRTDVVSVLREESEIL